MLSKPFESLKRCLVGLALGTREFSAGATSQTPAKIVTPVAHLEECG